jgi:hypothetical protein
LSPNQVIPVESLGLNPIAESVLKVPTLTYDVTKDGIVIARKADLVVRTPALNASPSLLKALNRVATRVGNLADIKASPPEPARVPESASSPDQPIARDHEPEENGPLSQVEIWRLKDAARNSIDESRQLRTLVEDQPVRTPRGDELLLPAVSPNHVAILSPTSGGCPATPPTPATEREEAFVQPPARESTAKVTILDSGYIWIAPPHRDESHRNLDQRVRVVLGQWLNTATGTWEPDRPDGLYLDWAGQLDGISGHGTFIAGLISHIAPRTRLEVVGLRNQEVEIDGLDPSQQLGLFETEVAIAHAMVRRCDTDVIQCGFAFPTLDDYPSVPFAAAMAEIRQESAPHRGHVAVVAPAGNEQSSRRYWPAALPDVIGVASTNRRANARAWFSNWGQWCDCCTRGEHVYSTFVHWRGSVEGRAISDVENFDGWATWNGTSFAAPKVSAAIAQLVARTGNPSPEDAGEELIAGTGGVPVSTLTDASLSGAPGVSLPHLQI